MERRFVKTYSQHLTCDSKILIHLVAVATCFNLIGCVALFSCPKRVLCVIGQYFTIITVMYSVLFTSCWKLISKYSLCCLNIALFDYVLIRSHPVILHYMALFSFLQSKTNMQQSSMMLFSLSKPLNIWKLLTRISHRKEMKWKTIVLCNLGQVSYKLKLVNEKKNTKFGKFPLFLSKQHVVKKQLFCFCCCWVLLCFWIT